MDIVERVARAICREDKSGSYREDEGDLLDWAVDDDWQYWIPEAEAAIREIIC